MEESLFDRKVREKREREAQERVQEQSTEYQDLIPERDPDRSDESYELDAALERIEIVDAYDKWIGKMKPVVRPGQREGVMISCPVPGHRDNNPSAWLNLDKKTWHCAACDQGGDIYDLASFAKGYNDKSYKDGVNFPRLKEEMALDFGFSISHTAGITVVSRENERVEEVPEDPEPEQSASVTILVEDDPDNDSLPTLDWRAIVPPGTFLCDYMNATVIDDCPEEYHLFHALLALGFACGKDVKLWDTKAVYSNLFVCLLGPSGIGKSKARAHLDELMSEVLPFEDTDPFTKGMLRVSSPGSPEVIIQQFQREIIDPSNPKNILGYAPVRGLVEFNELSGLISRANRTGSPMKSTLQEFYDMWPKVTSPALTTGMKQAHNPFASALTTTQPKSLRRLLTGEDTDSGFVNRWLFVTGGLKPQFAIGGARVDLTSSVNSLREIVGWAGSFSGGTEVQWSEPAAKIWTEFFRSTVEPDKKMSGSGDGMLMRMDLTMKKLILLFTANLKMREVPEEAVHQAIGCYGYLRNAYGIPSGMIGSTRSRDVSEAVEGVIIRQTEKDSRGVTNSYLKKLLTRHKYEDWELVKAIETLERIGSITKEVSKKGTVGRPGVRYKYVG